MSTEATKMSGSSGFQTSNNERNNGTNNEDTPEKTVSIFSSDYKKHDDLKQMLDSSKDNLKLEAMKRVIGLIAKGKDASGLFPAVVKNVVSKNTEIKKLVYVYLTRYAEEQQDLALLSISTFQRALKDPNQLIRASALRVLSSIRVPIIVTIMMLAIKEAVTDMSPYVRKTAALAIPKLFSMDAELKDDLIVIIEKLLADKTTLVAGSAIHAFEAVCPERIDLIHKNFRKLCNLLIDVDEWGQVMIINMLTRYSRTQFTNPNVAQNEVKNENNDSDKDEDDIDRHFLIDPDHRLLLRSTKPLLQSRNSSVVMAVAQLYYYVAPSSEVHFLAKALIRLLRAPREIQIVVLKNIVTIAQKNREIFQQYIKNFFIHSDESIHVKLLKLEILTSLSNENNISTLLREFQTYVLSNDKEFAAAAIHSIGRCASTIPEVTEACLSGLVSLISKKDETVVAESVVVLKRLLQLNPAKNSDIIKHLAKMTDKVTIPMARASILWLIGEYSDYVPKIAPDVLRKMAKSFCDEVDIVKLQIINLAVKLFVTNQKQTSLLVQYILNLAKYDQNYDIRDRARFLKALTINSEKCPTLSKHAKKILLGSKPAPVLESAYKDSDQYQLGTLSHSINSRVNGYQELPDFPLQAPDPTVRNVEIKQDEETKPNNKRSQIAISKKANKTKSSLDAFYSDGENESENQSTEGPDPSDSDSEEVSDDEEKSNEKDSTSDDSEESSDDTDEEDSDENEVKPKINNKVMVKSDSKVSITTKIPKNLNSNESSSNESSEKNSESESDSESSSESDDSTDKKTKNLKPQVKPVTKNTKKQEQQEASLLDLDFTEPISSFKPQLNNTILSPSLALDLSELSNSKSTIFNDNYIPKTKYELLSRINGNGLQIQYCFVRSQNISSPKMTNIRLMFNNFTDQDLKSFQVLSKKAQSGVSVSEFVPMDISKGGFTEQTIGIDFNETTNPVNLEIGNDIKKWNVSISCRVGELFQPNFISENEFDKMQMKLKGMNEITNKIELARNVYTSGLNNIKEKILENANMCQIPCSVQNLFKFTGLTLSNKVPLYLMIKFESNNSNYNCMITINCEKIILANMLLKEIKEVIST